MAKKAEEKNIGGRPTGYSPDFCVIAEEILSAKGVPREAVITKLKTTRRTFERWVIEYADFRAAVERGLAAGKAALIADGVENLKNSKFQSYNTPLFIRILQTVYRDSDQAVGAIEGWNDTKTLDDKFDLVVKSLGDGELTPEQASKFSDVLLKKLQLSEFSELKKRLETLENS